MIAGQEVPIDGDVGIGYRNLAKRDLHHIRPRLHRREQRIALRRTEVRARREVGETEDHPAASHVPGELRDETLDAERMLAGIAPEYREALILTKFHGYSLEEAAQRAGITASAMKTRVHRAIKKVRKLLEEDLP